jgi:hypothetical protein
MERIMERKEVVPPIIAATSTVTATARMLFQLTLLMRKSVTRAARRASTTTVKMADTAADLLFGMIAPITVNSVNHKFAVPDWQIQDISHGFANPPERFVIY